MHLNFVDPQKKIFRDFGVLVLSPLPKNENSETTEVLQKPKDTEIWEYNFKNPWNAVNQSQNGFNLKRIQPHC